MLGHRKWHRKGNVTADNIMQAALRNVLCHKELKVPMPMARILLVRQAVSHTHTINWGGVSTHTTGQPLFTSLSLLHLITWKGARVAATTKPSTPLYGLTTGWLPGPAVNVVVLQLEMELTQMDPMIAANGEKIMAAHVYT
eukprot:TRINITY_DN4457_c0_g1_i2.p1 TRINITY_DN4457_c0_g1~~TRINITY_DN4457_c0_g1_i2.p1  ORF type:complete len:141 (-),score=9.14 TRINITY_DN4457_c0_g1_i2:405-827(-)